MDTEIPLLTDDLITFLQKARESAKAQTKPETDAIFDDVIEPAAERTVTVSMRIPEDIYNQIRAEARERNVSKSFLMSKFFVNSFKTKEKAVSR